MSTNRQTADRELRPLALVVGGSAGFGLGITSALIGQGFTTITIGRSLTVAGASEHYPVDISDQIAWRKTFSTLAARKGLAIDVLIYTVGYARVFPFRKTPPPEWERHVWMNFSYIAESYPLLEGNLCNDARVATTGSQWSHENGWPDLTPYITAKHALACLTREYAMAFPQRAFRHYCVPTMDTRGYEEVVASAKRSDASLHARSAPTKPADPCTIAKAFVNDLLVARPSLDVIRDVTSEGSIQQALL